MSENNDGILARATRAAQKIERDKAAVEFYERRAEDQSSADNAQELDAATKKLGEDRAAADALGIEEEG